jgi:hypothetical protein
MVIGGHSFHHSDAIGIGLTVRIPVVHVRLCGNWLLPGFGDPIVKVLARIFARRARARLVGFIVCLIGGGSLAAGCSGDPSTSPATVKLTSAQIAVLTDAKGPDVAYNVAHNAIETLIERCMRARGLVYYPGFERAADAVTLAAVVPGVPEAAIGLTARQADGYGFYSKAVQLAAHPGAQNQLDQEDKYIASLPAKARQRYLLALGGPISPRESVTIPGAGIAHIESSGCRATARRQVYGSLANFVVATTGWSLYTGQLDAAVQADQEFPAVIAKWSTCMTAHSYKYASPEDLWNGLGTRIYRRPAPANHALEIRTAVQDYRCSQAVRLIPTIKALRARHARYVSKALAGNIARVTVIFAHALKAARALHVTG